MHFGSGFDVLDDGREALLLCARTGIYFRLLMRPGLERLECVDGGLPLARAAAAATQMINVGAPRQSRALVPPHHTLALSGTIAEGGSELEWDASSTRLLGETYIFCGKQGTGKTTLVKLFEALGAAGSIDDPRLQARRGAHRQSAVWFLEPGHRAQEQIVHLRLKPIPAAVRVLVNLRAPANREARVAAFDLAAQIAGVRASVVSLPARLESLDRAVRLHVGIVPRRKQPSG